MQPGPVKFGAATTESTGVANGDVAAARRADVATAALSLLLLGLLAVGLHVAGGHRLVASAPHVRWWQLAVGFAAAEAMVFDLHLSDRESHSFTLTDLPLAAGLLMAGPHALLAGCVVGSGAVLVARQWRSPQKVAFNLSLYAGQVGITLLAAHVVGAGTSITSPHSWLAVAAGTFSVWALSLTSISLVIRWHGGRTSVATTAVLAAATTAAATALALVGVLVVATTPAALVLLAVLCLVVFGAERAHSSLRQRFAGVSTLYEFTQGMAGATVADQVIGRLVGQARELMQADFGEVVLLDADGDALHWWSRGEEPVRSAAPLDATLASVIAARATVVMARTSRNAEHRHFLERHGLLDAAVTTLSGDDGAVGALVVGDSRSEVRAFGGAEMRLFETLANHAAVALRNGRLVERLQHEVREREHQALHDPLTGLPNRTLLRRVVDEAAQVPGSRGAVLLIDLDRFKDVNDTLGHHNGDRLLEEVARRLLDGVGERGQVARLSGDEFAVLLPGIAPADALTTAEALRHALTRPAHIDEVALDVPGSIGVALWPDHGLSATELLKCADVAMYAAKGTDAGVSVYRPDDDVHTPQRLAMGADLRQAVDRRELEVWFQPKADVATGAVIGAEALVRWRHPRLGFVPPDAFVPLAEQTGLIGALTAQVLSDAAAACATWRAAGHRMSVAVNVAARSLLDGRLPDDVAAVLRRHGLPASALVLEITETGIMSDMGRSLGVLHRLASTGVQLSIDDFGTGYSSMSYLQRLPVHEVKIDRAFVSRMVDHAPDRAIVRSITDLSHSLGKRTVAEGVEDQATWDALGTIGCDQVQGWWLARPMPAADVLGWLAERRVAAIGA